SLTGEDIWGVCGPETDCNAPEADFCGTVASLSRPMATVEAVEEDTSPPKDVERIRDPCGITGGEERTGSTRFEGGGGELLAMATGFDFIAIDEERAEE